VGSRADLHHIAVRFPDLLRRQARPPCARKVSDEKLKPQISRVHRDNLDVYGADKVWTQMKREGYPVARCTVERLMKDLHLSGADGARHSSAPPSPTRPSTDRPTS
jgi:hypothetical protein